MKFNFNYSIEQSLVSNHTNYLTWEAIQIAKPIMHQLLAWGAYNQHPIYFTHWPIYQIMGNLPMPWWFTVELLWDI